MDERDDQELAEDEFDQGLAEERLATVTRWEWFRARVGMRISSIWFDLKDRLLDESSPSPFR